MISIIFIFFTFLTFSSSYDVYNNIYEDINLITCIKYPSSNTCNNIKNDIVKMCANLLHDINFFPKDVYKSDIVKICPYVIYETKSYTYYYSKMYGKDVMNILSNSTKLEYYIYFFLPNLKDNKSFDLNKRLNFLNKNI